ncbi:MAG: hypothetical protein A2158_01655 [Chloroflexi bacterium RBG_13_46_14]|nr:MAG: hypothetical protein A2158_01655 [Chloroflexi bacterium RBG_13_46_14]
MGHHGNRGRECLEGWTGRRRNYKCRNCGDRFQHDGGQLEDWQKYCDVCLEIPEVRAKCDTGFAEWETKQALRIASVNT